MANVEHYKIPLELLPVDLYRDLEHLRFFGEGAHQLQRDGIHCPKISWVLSAADCQSRNNS